MKVMEKLKKIIVISGMTGVGKTNIARILAQHINGEIVATDSMQVIIIHASLLLI